MVDVGHVSRSGTGPPRQVRRRGGPSLEGDGAHACVHVNFARAGAKWLAVAYANLEAL